MIAPPRLARFLPLPLLLGAAPVATPAARYADVPLASLDLSKMRVQPAGGRGGQATVAQADRAMDGNTIRIGGRTFEHGVGTRATSVLFVRLDGGAQRFTAMVGADDNPLPAPPAGAPQPTTTPPPVPIVFRVLGDGRVLHVSRAVARGDAPEPVSVDVRGIRTLVLQVKPVDGTRPVAADWADATFSVSGAAPVAIDVPVEPREILTPKPGPAPRINGPSLTGVTPGHDVLYRIPVSGTRPMTYGARGLPNGLTLDPATGIIRGTIAARGRYPVTLTARNAVGSASKAFTFVAEGQLALTPAMGWNSWNVFGRAVSDSLARAAADAMVAKGLADHGWTYVNLDDGWERSAREQDPLYEGPVRAPDGTMLTNKKFPDMKALGDYIHAKGLKFGIYSGPGPTTCQRLEASWQHELQDFRTFAGWGVDYLKYDWCGYSSVLAPGETNQQLAVLKRPYQVGRTALNQVPRDIVYSLCQYGWGNVWEWGAEPGIEGNSWRTTGDITDTWESMAGIGFRQVGNSKYASPGHWNDPDMLVIGKVGWGPRLRDSRLTPNEQYVHITLWTLLASPLLLGNDLTQMDDFELNLVTNDEVLAVHQDALGKAADRVARDGELEVWARPLADGSLAVGLFNRDEMDMPVTVKWSDLGITGKRVARDLWRQKDLGTFDGQLSRVVPRHGTVFVKLSAR
ncbi:Glycosyl hydrolase family 98 putative carbohydrate binding module [Gemmatirosa kalamazoonensis]|uniref:Alpha-galactosidase n=1 Tax=Gemmatirosa kalamazoonensis TaxID=861299 RepID=W0RNJ1_9BACT|nr:NPCBM/NEW2 domain-containing protein [Gemmatirosa kalamazoonensis]AHG92067.1 Glycosyl hydrolase family 98 putative carbohydrate binding module [Gemmatirosa kalamazoonensis]